MHPSNAPSPIAVTDGGIVISVREVHSLKAWSSIASNDEGSFIFFNALQMANALFPILVTVGGIEISVSDRQFLQKFAFMAVKLRGIES